MPDRRAEGGDVQVSCNVAGCDCGTRPFVHSRSDGSFSIGSAVWPGVSKLVEEIGELGQVLGKLIALHGGTDHWDGSDLRVRLVEEIGDVLGAVNFLVAENLTIRERVNIGHRAEAKRLLFETWHHEQGDPDGE